MSIESVIGAGRRLVARTLLDRCVIAQKTTVRDASGGRRETWVARNGGRAVACRFVALTEEDPAIRLETVLGRPEAILLLPLDATVAEGDRVTNQVDGSLWLAVSVLTVPSELATVARIAIKGV
jgi:hypothetical protein